MLSPAKNSAPPSMCICTVPTKALRVELSANWADPGLPGLPLLKSCVQLLLQRKWRNRSKAT